MDELKVLYSNDTVGKLTVSQDGMTYKMNAECRFTPKTSSILRVYLKFNDIYVPLGVIAPSGNAWRISSRISESQLRHAHVTLGNCEYAVISDTAPTESACVPITAEAIAPSANNPDEWRKVENIDDILSDTVLCPLLRGKDSLITKKSDERTLIAMPYDILDEIYFTPAFCLMKVVFIDDKTYFALTLDENGWPISPIFTNNT